MPAWLLTLLVKVVLPLVISWLENEGFIDAAGALAVKGGVAIVQEVKSLKTYSAPADYVDSKNGGTG